MSKKRIPKGKNEHNSLIAPLADRESDGAWKLSKLDGVKAYLLKQINS